MLQFLHAADIHLDSPFRGLETYEGAPVDRLRQATRRALENLVSLALDESVPLVVIAGDLYDGEWYDFNTCLYFVSQMRRLREANVRVVIIRGNHDAANRNTRALSLPDNVTLLSEKEPQTEIIEELGIAVHGQSFPSPKVDFDLSAAYPPAVSGLFNIGLLHTCLTGHEQHARYAPCTLDGLRRLEYQYWALGHVHTHAIHATRPHVVFSGNTQGRHARESGPKGCVLVTVEGDAISTRFRPLDVVRWHWLPVEVKDLDEPTEQARLALRELVAQNADRLSAVRVEIVAPQEVHQRLASDPERTAADVRSAALDEVGDQAWIERVRVRPADFRLEPRMPEGPLGELTSLLAELRFSASNVDHLLDALSGLEKKLPLFPVDAPSDLRLKDADWIRGLLDEVEPLLVGKLRSDGGTR